MTENKEESCCENFVLWDKTKCCPVCHSRERKGPLPFYLKFQDFECRMCCNAAQWATRVFHLVDVIDEPEDP